VVFFLRLASLWELLAYTFDTLDISGFLLDCDSLFYNGFLSPLWFANCCRVSFKFRLAGFSLVFFPLLVRFKHMGCFSRMARLIFPSFSRSCGSLNFFGFLPGIGSLSLTGFLVSIGSLFSFGFFAKEWLANWNWFSFILRLAFSLWFT